MAIEGVCLDVRANAYNKRAHVSNEDYVVHKICGRPAGLIQRLNEQPLSIRIKERKIADQVKNNSFNEE